MSTKFSNVELLDSQSDILDKASKGLKEIGLFDDHNSSQVQLLLQRVDNLDKKYKISALVRGKVDSAKTSILSAILKEHLSPISSAPETKHLIAILYDQHYEVPELFQANLSNVYNENYGYFCITADDLHKVNPDVQVSGIPAIFDFLKKSNENRRKIDDKYMKDSAKKDDKELGDKKSDMIPNKENEESLKSGSEEMMYVIKMRVHSLEKDLTEFDLSRFLLIDFPGSEDQNQNSKIIKEILRSRSHIMIDTVESAKHLLELRPTVKRWKHHFRIMTKLDLIDYKEFVEDEEILNEGQKMALASGVVCRSTLLAQGNWAISESKEALQYVLTQNYKKRFKEAYETETPEVFFVNAKEENVRLIMEKFPIANPTIQKFYESRFVDYCGEDQGLKRVFAEIVEREHKNGSGSEVTTFKTHKYADYRDNEELFNSVRKTLKEMAANTLEDEINLCLGITQHILVQIVLIEYANMFPSIPKLASNRKVVDDIYQEFQTYVHNLFPVSKKYHQRLNESFTTTIKSLQKIVDIQYFMPSSIETDVNLCIKQFRQLNEECTLELMAGIQDVYSSFQQRLANYISEHNVPDVLEVIINEIWQSISLKFDDFNQNILENTSRAIDALGATITAAGFIVAGASLGAFAFTVASAATRVGVSFYAAAQGLGTGAITIGTSAIGLAVGWGLGALVAIVGTGYMVYKYNATKSSAKTVLDDMRKKQTSLVQEAQDENSLIQQKLNSVLVEYKTRTKDVLKIMEKNLARDDIPMIRKVKEIKEMIMALPKFKETIVLYCIFIFWIRARLYF
jgi:hypothetical protein